ncbi:MAG: diaminopimelate decarboxylase family protein [Hyphomicrobiales bacterium]
MLDPARYPLDRIAARVGTPFYLYDAARLRERTSRLAAVAARPGLAVRYSMKANSARPVLDTVRAGGLWIDAAGGNEVLRALRAGFPGGFDPPEIMLATDVFRDGAAAVAAEQRVLTSVGSPGMVEELSRAGYEGPIGVRVNPGFGHGHVAACDTGGPSSKHGVWPDDLARVRRDAREAGLPIATLHAHVGTGPTLLEFDENLRRLVDFFAALLPEFPDVVAVDLGGGFPFPYRPDEAAYDDSRLSHALEAARRRLTEAASRPIRVEVEPGRFLAAAMGILVARVKEVKRTTSNEKSEGHTFAMVDAGFCDFLRPALYGSYHRIDVVGAGANRKPEPLVVAGPLCESGDVFTRDAHELLDPRPLPRPEPGDLVVLQDAGAYGASMSMSYVSMGRAPIVWWDEGRGRVISRRETLDDLTGLETDEAI